MTTTLGYVCFPSEVSYSFLGQPTLQAALQPRPPQRAVPAGAWGGPKVLHASPSPSSPWDEEGGPPPPSGPTPEVAGAGLRGAHPYFAALPAVRILARPPDGANPANQE